jgi:hypothetical protein
VETHPIVLEPWQLAVKLDVLLCCPNASAGRRQTLCDAIGAQMVGVTVEQVRRDFPEELAACIADLSATYPDYIAEARRRISERFRFLRQRAMRVGLIILPLISKAAIGQFPNLVERARQPTLNEVARYVLRTDGRPHDEDSVHQFLKAEVRPWYRVAQLAVAFQLMAREYADRGAVMSFDYQDTPFFAEVLRRADEAADHIRATPAAKGIASRLVSLREFDCLRG